MDVMWSNTADEMSESGVLMKTEVEQGGGGLHQSQSEMTADSSRERNSFKI